MGKISKNARVSGGQRVTGAKDMVKVIKAFKSKSGSYSFKEKVMHKDKVKDFLKEK